MSAAAPTVVKKPFWSIRRREAATFYLVVTPWVIGFLLFTVVPVLYAM
jgi:hypothetical protein